MCTTRLLSLLLVSMLCGCTPSTEESVSQADKLLAAGEFDRAAKLLGDVLAADPNDSAALLHMARASYLLGDATAALAYLNRHGAADADSQALRLETMLLLGRAQEVIDRLAGDKLVADVDRARLLGMAYDQLGKPESAAAQYAAAMKAAPGSPLVLTSMARHLMEQRKYDEALALLSNAGGDAQVQPQVLLAKGLLLSGLRRWQEARGTLGRALEAGKASISRAEVFRAHAAMADASLELNELAPARTSLASLQLLGPESPLTYFMRSRLLLAEKKPEQAVIDLQKCVGGAPNLVEARMLLAITLQQLGRLEQAALQYRAVLALVPAQPQATRLLAQLELGRANPVGAQSVLEKLPAAALASGEGASLLAAALVQSGDVERGLRLAEQSVVQNPADVDSRFALATLYLAAGRREAAAKALQELPDTADAVRRDALLLMALPANWSTNDQTMVRQILARNNSQPAVLAVAARVLELAGDHSNALELQQRVVALSPNSIAALRQLADLHSRQGDPRAAAGVLQKAIDIEPRNESHYVVLARVLAASGDQEAAKFWLQKAIGAQPAATEARLELAQLLGRQGNQKKAAEYLQQAADISKGSMDTLLRVGQVWLLIGDAERALAALRNPGLADRAVAHYVIALALEKLGRKQEAMTAAEKSHSIDRNWLPASVLQVRLELDNHGEDLALRKIERVRSPKWPEGTTEELRAEIYLRGNRLAQAATELEKAYEKAPNGRLAARLAQVELSRKTDPTKPLIRWLARHPDDANIRRLMAGYHLSLGQREQAIATYQQILQSSPGDVVSLNNLAWLYYETKDRRALATAESAWSKSPKMAQVHDTYGWILVESGRVQDGMNILEGALQLPQDDASKAAILKHLAVARSRQGGSSVIR